MEEEEEGEMWRCHQKSVLGETESRHVSQEVVSQCQPLQPLLCSS